MTEVTCTVPGCDKRMHARSYCGAHYSRWKKLGKPGPAVTQRRGGVCDVVDCGRPHYSRGWCSAHYKRWYRHGDPLIAGKFARIDTTEKRFWAKVDINGPFPEIDAHLGRCWLFTDAPDSYGYGKFRHGGKQHAAHRISFEISVGPIPEGLTIDHLCCVRNCVNPSHLEPVTAEENLRRRHVRAATGGKRAQMEGA